MLKQRAVMLNEPQDRMLNMPCSGMLPPTMRQPPTGAPLFVGADASSVSMPKSLVFTRLFAAFRNGPLMSCLVRQQPRACLASGRPPLRLAVNGPSGNGFRLSGPARAHFPESASHGSELEERCARQYRRARSRSRISAGPAECRRPSRAVVH